MRREYNAKFSKPYPQSHKRSPYYKSSFHLKLYHILKKYRLKYNENNNSIINLDTGEPFLIFSFDESSQQFISNNVRVWSLKKPQMIKNTTKHKTNAAGSYSLTKEGKDDLVFLENSKKESIVYTLISLREKNPQGVILLLIDNFPSHRAQLVKKYAKENNMELCFLPTASPQLQPEEKIWYQIKRTISEFKIDKIENYKNLTKEKSEEILKDIISKSFYQIVQSKNKWNKVLNNYIKPVIKLFNPNENVNWEVQKIY